MNRLHRAKEHSMADHFREREGGEGGVQGTEKLHSSECFL